ncbi:spore germination protein GerPE [Gracilibacillus saliphilus]|uniref:spore germination protein GerPE n=1 Tax=Gracilibacillus saliphilus TaxID=543890 RepID=UPI0013D0D9D0|nr:spore germination protein GerPE [Gracilibacillus saliphilus]
MMPRTTNVKQTRINSISHSSLFQIGDTKELKPQADVLAVQKEGGISSDKGFELNQYRIFNTTIPSIPDPEIVVSNHCHHHQNIYVSNIDVTAISTSAITQLGSSKKINSLARLKHIRILKDENEEEN